MSIRNKNDLVEWEPKVNRWTGMEIQAVLKGAETLDGEWKAEGSPHLAAVSSKPRGRDQRGCSRRRSR